MRIESVVTCFLTISLIQWMFCRYLLKRCALIIIISWVAYKEITSYYSFLLSKRNILLFRFSLQHFWACSGVNFKNGICTTHHFLSFIVLQIMKFKKYKKHFNFFKFWKSWRSSKKFSSKTLISLLSILGHAASCPYARSFEPCRSLMSVLAIDSSKFQGFNSHEIVIKIARDDTPPPQQEVYANQPLDLGLDAQNAAGAHMSRAISRTMKLPNSEKPFQCNVCEKQFRQLSTLTNHMKIHTVRIFCLIPFLLSFLSTTNHYFCCREKNRLNARSARSSSGSRVLSPTTSKFTRWVFSRFDEYSFNHVLIFLLISRAKNPTIALTVANNSVN